METQTRPKELSKDLIHNLRQKNDPNVKMTGILQIVDMKEDGSFMSLSDGFSYSEVALFKTIRPRIKELNLKQNDIISVTMLLHKGSINVVVSFEPVYSGVGGTIGKPLDYNTYSEGNHSNVGGDAKIPKQLWNLEDNNKQGSKNAPSKQAQYEDDEYTPISLLTSGSTSWMIKARVTKKGAKKEFTSAKGKGSVFNCVLIDNTGGIQATFFTDAAEKFHDYLVENNVYLFSNGDIRKASKFNSTSNTLELHFSVKAEVIHVEDDGKIDNIKFNFIKVADIAKKDPKSSVDVIGMLTEVSDATDFALKSGESKKKRNFKIKDDTNFEIEGNIWGAINGDENLKQGATVILTDMQVGDFKGRNLNSKGSSRVITQLPDLPRVREFIMWRNNASKNPQQTESIRSLMNVGGGGGDAGGKPGKGRILVTVNHFKKISDDLLLNDTDKKDYYNLNATVSAFSNSFYYDKCPNENCFKKVQVDESNPNSCDCGNCGVVHKAPVARFIGNVKITDHTGSIYLNFSTDQVGNVLYGKTAQELKDMQTVSKEGLQLHLKNRTNVTYAFRVFAKKEYYNGEMKIRYNVAAVWEQVPEKTRLANSSLLATLAKYKKMLNQATS